MNQPIKKKTSAWQGRVKKIQLLELFIPKYEDLMRLDGVSITSEIGVLLGASTQRTFERSLAKNYDGTPTIRQHQSQTSLLNRLMPSVQNAVNPSYLKWVNQLVQCKRDLKFEFMEWDGVRHAMPVDVVEHVRRTSDHWALLQRRMMHLYRDLDLARRLKPESEYFESSLQELCIEVKKDPLISQYWGAAELQHMQANRTIDSLHVARVLAFINALISQLGLVEAIYNDGNYRIAEFLALDRKTRVCKPGSVLLNHALQIFGYSSIDALLNDISIGGNARPPDRSTLMAWRAGKQFPTRDRLRAMCDLVPEERRKNIDSLPRIMREGALAWAARRINGILRTFGPRWQEIKPFLGEAPSFDAWLGIAVERWTTYWLDNPLPEVYLTPLPPLTPDATSTC